MTKFRRELGAQGAFVAWTPYAGRTDGFVQAFNLIPIYRHYLKLREPLYAPIKYIPQFCATLNALWRARPETVFVMVPPVFAALAVSLYAAFSGARFVIDLHSGAIESRKWRWSLPLVRHLARRAAAVMVTNKVHQAIVTSWSATALIVSDSPPFLKGGLQSPVPNVKPKRIFYINRFGSDEPTEAVLAAAATLPNIRFLVSGDTARAKSSWLQTSASNLTFTGWLSIEEFWSQLRRANAILTLTNSENTILRGGWEAMYLGQPLITSRTKALMRYFSGGTVFVDNNPQSISNGVLACLSREQELCAEMLELRIEKYLGWKGQIRKLERILNCRFSFEATDHMFDLAVKAQKS